MKSQVISKKVGTYDYLVKFVMVGDSNCGKTCLLNQFCDNIYVTDYITTIGVDFNFKTMEVDNKKLKVQIWDTAGQERFKSITQSYYRGANIILIVFDLTRRETLNNIIDWHKNIRQYNSDENTEIFLVGNKSDLEYDITVRDEDIDKVLKETKINKCYKVSVKMNNGLEKMFEELCRVCLLNKNFKENMFVMEKNANNNTNIIDLSKKELINNTKSNSCC